MLTTLEAKQRLIQFGPNAIAHHDPSLLIILGRQILTPINGLLAAAAVIALGLGEETDAITIAVILAINAALGFVQEHRSENAVKKLRAFLSHTARVRRSNEILTISREEVVPGDTVILETGDMAPADITITKIEHPLVDESILTGESAPVDKDVGDAVWGGTTIVSGGLEGEVVATGNKTKFGHLAALAAGVHKKSAAEAEVRQFSKFLTGLVALTLALLFVAKMFLDGGAERAAEFLLFSLALAISVVPEALPVVMTITFSRGALRLARRHVVVKRLSAIEDLGQIEILCTDKTGTITENRLRIVAVESSDRDACLAAAALSVENLKNPFDAAIHELQKNTPPHEIVESLPFNHERRWSGVKVKIGRKIEMVIKGAPENVLALCRDTDEQPALDAFAKFGRKGYRVLAVAAGSDEKHLKYLGLIAFEDPLKPTAARAIKLAEELNVRVKILTGDSPEVAGAIATEVRIIEKPEDVVTGGALEAMDGEEFRRTIEERDVFARVTPEQKFRIIETLMATHAVGFLGEGVNDAPALKLANVALAVPSASDISKDAADAILLDRSLLVIVEAIREGRAIVSNVAKYIRYTLAGNFGNFLSVAAVSLFIPFLPMLPVQILLTNLLTDLPLVAVATDRVERAELKGPRRLHVRSIVFSALILGMVSAMFDLIFFGWYRTAPAAVLQTNWFIFSILTELATIFVIRTALPAFRAVGPSKLLVWSSVGAAVVAVALPLSYFGQGVFRFVSPLPMDFAVIGILVALMVVATEVVKLSLVKRLQYVHRHH